MIFAIATIIIIVEVGLKFKIMAEFVSLTFKLNMGQYFILSKLKNHLKVYIIQGKKMGKTKIFSKIDENSKFLKVIYKKNCNKTITFNYQLTLTVNFNYSYFGIFVS